MTPEMRYMAANARLTALSDVQNWTAQDLQDVFALTAPSVTLEDWLKRLQPQPEAVAASADDPDPETSRTVDMLMGPKGQALRDLGILTITEEKAAT